MFSSLVNSAVVARRRGSERDDAWLASDSGDACMIEYAQRGRSFERLHL
jgi:hypothetical protein